MHRKTHELLVEALRRFECFCVPRDGRKWKMKDLQHAWTGLGTFTEYKKAIDEGYMTYANKPNPYHDQWWKLTEKGAQLLLEWHKAGYGCDLQSFQCPIQMTKNITRTKGAIGSRHSQKVWNLPTSVGLCTKSFTDDVLRNPQQIESQ